MKRIITVCTLVVACWLSFRPAHAASHTVEIVGFVFSPANLTVNAGDTVTWIQRDSAPHTSTSGTDARPDGKWDSGLMTLSDNTEFAVTFSESGQFPYYCELHPSMLGTITVQAAQPQAPTVILTAPSPNATFTAPAAITLEATASDPNGTVAKVEFYNGTTLLGTDTTAPYELNVTLEAGNHSLSAKATDNEGNIGASVAVAVLVNPPSSQKNDDPIPERIAKGDLTVELATLAEGLVSPLGLADPGDGTGRLFVYEQTGLICIIQYGNRLTTPLLDVRDRLVTIQADYDERGLLGLALHPRFPQTPLLYTYTSEPVTAPADFTGAITNASHDHQSVVAEWRINSTNANRVDLSSRRELLRIDQPQFNHNGGDIAFGPDGFLYIALGDGGAADDQGDGHVAGGNAQEIQNIYGNVLRIDPAGSNSANGRYGIPPTNPFVGAQGLDEIFAYGFRNPYRMSFDRSTGELYVGDAGQNDVEEIDHVMSGGNYGWNLKEGSFFFDPNGTGDGFVTTMPVRPGPAGIDPIAEYDHDDGTAVIGGYVYRGSTLPLNGRYVFGDLGLFSASTGRLFYLDTNHVIKELRIGTDDRPLGLWLKGLGQDHTGEIYVFGSAELGPKGTAGKVLKLVPVSSAIEITRVQLEGSHLAISWSGGAGLFAVQKKTAVTESLWGIAALAHERTATVPADGSMGLFRVFDLAQSPEIAFTAPLSGAAEPPSGVNTSARGTAFLQLNQNTLSFTIEYNSFTENVTAAHIHGPATSTNSVGVMIGLNSFNGGSFSSNGVLSGSVTVTPDQRLALLQGKTYINLHTATHPGGEIRGQIAPVLFQAALSGAAERPNPVATPAQGIGLFLLVGKELTFEIEYHGLSGPAIGAHIHGRADASTTAGVMVDLQPFNGGSFSSSGTLHGTVTLTQDQLGALVDGVAYVNIHTAAKTGGEIRGQILPRGTSIPFSTVLSGGSEKPAPVTTTATGSGILSLEGDVLTFSLHYNGFTEVPSAAHIHGPASATNSVGVIVPLNAFNGGAFGLNGTLSGSAILTPAQRAMLLDGNTYVNIHTSSHSSGEIRGQIVPVLFSAGLTGQAEQPSPVTTSASGSGLAVLVIDRLSFNAVYSGLSGPALGAHIHGPATAFGTAGVFLNLQPFNGGGFSTRGRLSGSATLTPEQIGWMAAGLTYMNVHTSAHGGGEIRGQLRH